MFINCYGATLKAPAKLTVEKVLGNVQLHRHSALKIVVARTDAWPTEPVGGLHIPYQCPSDQRRAILARAVRDTLPREWLTHIHTLSESARLGVRVWERDRIEGDVLAHWLNRYSGAVAADMSEGDIRDRAEHIAAHARQAGLSKRIQITAENFQLVKIPSAISNWWEELSVFAARYGVMLKEPSRLTASALRGVALRLECARWWRRALRRMVARMYERGAIECGLVGAKSGAWYCSDRAVDRRMQQQDANEAAMRARVIESAGGQSMSVWEAAQAGVANKAIRRGELMTRIKGAEAVADASGLVGLFVTATCPSRFHAQLRHGGANPRYLGDTPAEAQLWLRGMWAKARASLGRQRIGIMGYRVAEPHHDGCPHWHMLMWCRPEHAETVEGVMRAYWLSDDGDEPGADKHRLTVKRMLSGGAAGYVAKYVAKNIDDTGIDAHTDGDAGRVQATLIEGVEVTPARRVEAWAATWGIRQFQAFGQPPVSVWRELRRVTQQQAAGGSDALALVWSACHRRGDRLADWGEYMRRQGGCMLPRWAYRFAVERVEREVEGRYGRVVERWACGVRDRAPGRHRERVAVTPTRRERWGGEGFGRREPPPWTRLNNCTSPRAARAACAPDSALSHAAALRSAGLLLSSGPP